MKILKTVNPHSLRILHVDYAYIYRHTNAAPVIIPIPLPSLAELTVCGAFKADSLTSSFATPSLRKLYIRSAISRAPDAFCDELKRLGPNLTHLRVVASEQKHFAQLLLAYCKPEKPLPTEVLYAAHYLQPQPRGTVNEHESEDYRQACGSLPDTLRHVIFEFAPMVVSGAFRCGNAFINYHECIHALKSIAKEGQTSGNVVFFDGKLDGKKQDDGSQVDTNKTLFMLPIPSELYIDRSVEHERERFAMAMEYWLEQTAGSGTGAWFE